jgi:ribonuclease P/MRP protein subunit RPP40
MFLVKRLAYVVQCNKCKIMHFGYNNHGINFEMNGQNLIEVKEERDLGIIMQHDLKWGNQCLKAAKTANHILGMIKRTFNCLSKEVVLPLYKSLVRLHLEFGIQAWRPYLRKDIDLLEGVQRRATKMIPSLKFKSYEDRLKELELTTLETRRLRGDLIEVFKIFKGLDNVDHKNFLN